VRWVLAEAGARALLAELAAAPPVPDTARQWPDAAGVVETATNSLKPLPRRNRACPQCGRDLREGGRQAKKRVYCSVRCRVRHHRARTTQHSPNTRTSP
jgi:hypothetical protein